MCSLEKVDLQARRCGAALVWADGLWDRWPRTLLPFGGFIGEFAPLERSQRQQGASSPSVRELRKTIAFGRFALAIFMGFHFGPKA